MAATNGTVLELLRKNTGRLHTVEEIAQDLIASESDVESILKNLKRVGQVEQGSWGDGRNVWGAVAQPAESK